MVIITFKSYEIIYAIKFFSTLSIFFIILVIRNYFIKKRIEIKSIIEGSTIENK